MQEQTRESFGYKWEHFPITGEKRPALAHGEDRIQRNGWSISEFSEWISGKRALDAGCGMGWYTEFLSKRNPTGHVYGVDIARPAIETGRNLGIDNLIVGDISATPFPDGVFDYVACEEVIHHTPSPHATLEHLVSKLKSGGTLTMYVYKEKPLLREHADTLIRDETTKMSIEDCLEFSDAMTQVGKALYEVDETIEVPDVPLLDIEGGEYTVHEFVYRYFLKCYFDWHTEDEEVSLATNFDWYHPEHAHRFTEEEVRSMATDNGLKIVHFDELMSGFSLRTRKAT